MKTAIITGITGQDGSYLAELLLQKNYFVHGIVRRSSTINTGRIDHVYEHPHLRLHYGDVTDASFMTNFIQKQRPNEIYHLAGQSHVKTSFDIPAHTAESVAMSTLYILEAVRRLGSEINCRYYQASSSEMFGNVTDMTDDSFNESTRFNPCSPYAIAKLTGYFLTVNYREAYGLHANNGILFNHESPRRGETFVTRKITRAVAKIKAGKQEKLFLGNIEARRDWGYALDYVEAMWLMLQQNKPGDYVIATGESHTVREFCEEAFKLADLDWTKYVEIDQKYYRPTELNYLMGDAERAEQKLGWKSKTSFQELVKIMVEADLKLEGITL